MATDPQSGAPGGTLAHKQPKVFGLFSMVLFGVSAILVADAVGSSAAMGAQGLSFWIVLGLLFTGITDALRAMVEEVLGGSGRPFAVPGGKAGRLDQQDPL